MEKHLYKTVGANGQISIGKEWAGKLVQVISTSGSIQIVPGDFIPESQKAFYTTEASLQLKDFDAWSSKNPAKKTDVKTLKRKLGVKKD